MRFANPKPGSAARGRNHRGTGKHFVGTDSFLYSVFDGFARSVNIAAVSMQVASVPLRWLASNGQLLLSWPPGWVLQAQTNSADCGLGTNWVTVADSHLTNQMAVPIWPANGSVFVRLGKDGKVIASGHWADDLKPLVEAALDEKTVRPLRDIEAEPNPTNTNQPIIP